MRCSLRRIFAVILVIVMIQLCSVLLHLMTRRRPARTATRHHITHDSSDEVWGTCDYKRCNPVKTDMLNVHLIPHSHDDVGWLRTLDQYYTGRHPTPFGNKTFINGVECVVCILKSVIPQLLQNPERRFIFIEMAFFSRFWDDSDNKTRADIVKLIRERRLEFATGGWCMSDAATTYYNDIIDQHTLGFDFINTHFGKCAQSNIAWHVDQFGHSREHSSIFAQMGFDAIFLGRISDQDRNVRKKLQNMEHIWNASPRNLGKKASLFTHVNHDGYFAPKHFVMDGWTMDKFTGEQILLPFPKEWQKTGFREIAQPFLNPQIGFDPKRQVFQTKLNGKTELVDSFLEIVKKIARSYRTNHVQIEMGSDFGYRNSHRWFHNIDSLIKYTNERQASGSKVNLLYSTPSCYTHYVNAANLTWREKDDDYFPYGTGVGEYWTGFYTSKGGLKKHVKDAGALLQTCKQLNVFTSPYNGTDRSRILKEQVAVLQHHDAITGTEKELVVKDYNKLLSAGRHACQGVVNDAYKMLSGDLNQTAQEFCPLLNISVCPPSETYSKFVATIYNPLSTPVTSWVRFPVSEPVYRVVDPSGNVIYNQVNPVSESTLHIPERTTLLKHELLFKAKLPPLGFNSYVVESISDTGNESMTQSNTASSDNMRISNNVTTVWKSPDPMLIEFKLARLLTLTIDKDLGIMTQIENVKSHVVLNLTQDFQYYVGNTAGRPTGAYIFNPLRTSTVRMGTNSKTKVRKGQLVTEVHQTFSQWASQVIRLYDSANYVEIEWTVGPIPVRDRVGKEVIAMYKTDLNTGGTFYTDSNGREMIERRRNHRPTWELELDSPVAGNYYPVTSKICITDPDRNIQLTVLTDRCQGGSSIRDGEIELLIHRRTMRDDGLGVGERLNELGQDGQGLILRGKHYLFVDTIENSARLHRTMSRQIHLPPTLSFIPLSTSYEEWKDTHRMSWSGMKTSLPDNVQLLTLDTVPGGNSNIFLLRLEHMYEVDEDKEYSQPVTLSLKALFSPFEIDEVEELSLGANFKLSEVHRLQWRSTQGTVTPEDIGDVSQDKGPRDEMTIVLKPMQIRTFHIYVSQSTTSMKYVLFNLFK